VIVANARKVRLIGESRKKDDRLDAQALARLARLDPQFIAASTEETIAASIDV
jgi:transposase